MLKFILTSSLLFFHGAFLVAQHPDERWFRSSSLSWSMAFSAGSEQLPEGYAYRPISWLGRYRFSRIGWFDLYAESQFAASSNQEPAAIDIEFGINLGISYYHLLSRRLVLSASIGTGPHYISVRTRLQARGFIFSDNFEIGLNYHPAAANFGLQIRARFRHISNAGLKDPNKGIDNLFLIFGVQKLI